MSQEMKTFMRGPARWLLPLLVEVRLAVAEGDLLAADVHALEPAQRLEGRTLEHAEGRLLAGLDGAERLLQAEHARGVAGDRGERLVLGKAPGGGDARVVGEVAR